MTGPAAERAETRLEAPPTAAIVAGLSAPIVYAAGVVIGGAVIPGYSHFVNMISEMTMVGVPNRLAIMAIFIFYNLLVVAFALLLPRSLPGVERRGVALGSLLLLAVAVAGVAMSAIFPTDRPTDPLTAIGWVHVGFAAVASVGTMATVLVFGLTLRRVRGWGGFSAFSFGCLAAIAISGIWTAIAAAQLSPIMGIAERVTIGVFIVWLFGFGLALARAPRASD